MGTEEIAMMLIVHSGDARSLAFNALEAAKEGNFEQADDLLKQSTEKSLEAHHVQMDLLAKESSGEKLELGVLLVHAQDHLMTSMLAQELIKEIIQVYRKIA